MRVINLDNEENKEKNKEKKLSFEVLNNIKASEDLGLFRCVQCGMCTSVCPAAKFSDYNPRFMVEKVLEDDNSIIEDENIWNCFYCYTCHSVCATGNSPCEINQILRQIAIDEEKQDKNLKLFASFGEDFLDIGIGGIPKYFFKDLNKDIEGWLDFKADLDTIREELSLGSVEMPQKSIEEIRKLLKTSKFHKRIDKLKGKSK
ncbi:MAG: 4Fe-4S dicluster domain-containing protein [Methanobrevibacter sp.]|jgi:heterodisulfide reductase subunit C|nr:4Fe-4S dicluster domain-containing protein [Methanobrevibacter sp.]